MIVACGMCLVMLKLPIMGILIYVAYPWGPFRKQMLFVAIVVVLILLLRVVVIVAVVAVAVVRVVHVVFASYSCGIMPQSCRLRIESCRIGIIFRSYSHLATPQPQRALAFAVFEYDSRQREYGTLATRVGHEYDTDTKRM